MVLHCHDGFDALKKLGLDRGVWAKTKSILVVWKKVWRGPTNQFLLAWNGVWIQKAQVLRLGRRSGKYPILDCEGLQKTSDKGYAIFFETWKGGWKGPRSPIMGPCALLKVWKVPKTPILGPRRLWKRPKRPMFVRTEVKKQILTFGHREEGLENTENNF